MVDTLKLKNCISKESSDRILTTLLCIVISIAGKFKEMSAQIYIKTIFELQKIYVVKKHAINLQDRKIQRILLSYFGSQ